MGNDPIPIAEPLNLTQLMAEAPEFDTMFFLGRGPFFAGAPNPTGHENITIHFKLAQCECSKRGKKVEIVLMHDAAWWAEAQGEYGDLRAEAPDDDMTVK